VGGLNYQTDLTDTREHPFNFSVKNKLVYTGHFFSFSWHGINWEGLTYEAFRKRLYTLQTFVRGLGFPFLLGEFGADTTAKRIPWNFITRYLKETDIDWVYWTIDGFKCDREK
jgi:hypothetical protein